MLKKTEISELSYLVFINITNMYYQKRFSKTNEYDVLSVFDKVVTVTIFRHAALHELLHLTPACVDFYSQTMA
jgi:hypothetical protein